MQLRSGDDGPSRREGMGASRYSSGTSRMRSERVHEIRERIAQDAYRSHDVADEVARRILRSADL